MNRCLKVFYCLLLAGFLTEAYSQSAINLDHPLTLQECIMYAVEHNQSIKSAKLDELNNRYLVKEVKSAALPQISGAGQYLYNYALAEQILPGEIFGGAPGSLIPVKFGVKNNLSGNVEVRQTIFNKSIGSGLRAASASQSLLELNTLNNTEELVYSMIQLYLQIQLSTEQQELLDANLERINQLIEISEIQLEEGLIKKLDVDQLVVNKTNLLSEVQILNIGKEQQLNLFKLYMGVDHTASLELAPYTLSDESYPLVGQLIIAENTTLQQLQKQVELTTYETENIKAGYYPTISAFAQLGWQGQSDRLFSSREEFKIQGSRVGVVGLNVAVPIFDGFKKKNQQHQIRIKQEKYLLDKDYLTSSIRMDFENAKNGLRENRTVVETQKENMKLAESLYNVTKLSYQEGVAPLTELLNAESSLKESQTQYLTALLRLKLAEADHLKASGQLTQLIRAQLPLN